MARAIALCTAWTLLAAGCSGTQATREVEEEPEGTRPSFGSESAGEDVGVLTPQLAQQGFQNQGCMHIEVHESVEVERPTGMAVVFTAELCEGYEDAGRITFIGTAIGNAYVMSTTLHPIPGLGGARTDAVQLLSLESPRPSGHQTSIVVMRYRTPPESESRRSWMEQLVIGTFSADALDLSVVQPLNYDVRVGGGRLVGEGSYELLDADSDGDLDLRMTLSARGTGCRDRRQCQNGEHSCEVTVPWSRGGYEVALEGDDCLFLGRLEL